LYASFVLVSLQHKKAKLGNIDNKPREVKASPPVLPIMTIEDRIEDDEKAQELASDANTMVDKTDNEAENIPAQPLEPEDTLAPEDYPKGLQFLFILLALILSIFMVALDLVCLTPSSLLTDIYMLILRADHRRNSHPKDHGSVS
jgi:hypothetical protein